MKSIKYVLMILAVMLLSACRDVGPGYQAPTTSSVTLDFSGAQDLNTTSFSNASFASFAAFDSTGLSVALVNIADPTDVIIADITSGKANFTGVSKTARYKLELINEYGISQGPLNLGSSNGEVVSFAKDVTIGGFETDSTGQIVAKTVTATDGTSDISTILGTPTTLEALSSTNSTLATTLAEASINVFKKQGASKGKTQVSKDSSGKYTVKLITAEAGDVQATTTFSITPSTFTSADVGKNVVSKATDSKQTTDLVKNGTRVELTSLSLDSSATALGNVTEFIKSTVTAAVNKASTIEAQLVQIDTAFTSITTIDSSSISTISALKTGTAATIIQATVSEYEAITVTAVTAAATAINTAITTTGSTTATKVDVTTVTSTVTSTVATVATTAKSDVTTKTIAVTDIVTDTVTQTVDTTTTITWTADNLITALNALNSGGTASAFYTSVTTEMANNDIASIDYLLNALLAVNDLGNDTVEALVIKSIVSTIFGSDGIAAGDFNAESLISYGNFTNLSDNLKTIYTSNKTATGLTQAKFIAVVDAVQSNIKSAYNKAAYDSTTKKYSNINIKISGLTADMYLTKAHLQLLLGNYQIAASYLNYYVNTSNPVAPTAYKKSLKYGSDIYIENGIANVTEALTATVVTDTTNKLSITAAQKTSLTTELTRLSQ